MASNPPEKRKPLNYQIYKIIVGQWTCESVYLDTLIFKCLFPAKKLVWEYLDYSVANRERIKKRIEIDWADILSIRRHTNSLEVELRKPPRFVKEPSHRPYRSTEWIATEEDFTSNQASVCRRQTFHFTPGDLQEIMEKLVSGDKFWSDLVKIPFPTLPESLYFEQNGNNDNQSQGSFSVNMDLLHHQSQ
ncbi:hypothetical protein EUTSA_v10022346mg, partial [Eutrema salsugineum]